MHPCLHLHRELLVACWGLSADDLGPAFSSGVRLFSICGLLTVATLKSCAETLHLHWILARVCSLFISLPSCDTLFSYACFSQEVSFAWLLGLASRLDRVVGKCGNAGGPLVYFSLLSLALRSDNYTSCIKCDALAASSSLIWYVSVGGRAVIQFLFFHPFV